MLLLDQVCIEKVFSLETITYIHRQPVSSQSIFQIPYAYDRQRPGLFAFSAVFVRVRIYVSLTNTKSIMFATVHCMQRSLYWCDSLGGRGVYSCEPLEILMIRVRRTFMILTAVQGIVYDQGGQTHASPITTKQVCVYTLSAGGTTACTTFRH